MRIRVYGESVVGGCNCEQVLEQMRCVIRLSLVYVGRIDSQLGMSL